MRKLLLFISFCWVSVASMSQTIQLTNGGATTLSGTTGGAPISQFFEFMRFQVVYTAAELNAAGITGPKTVSQLGWYIATAPANALPSYKIRMANTTATNSAAHDAAALTEVYSNATYSPVAGGFDMLTLNGSFVWNGTDNLLVDVCYGAATYATPYGEVRTYAATTTSGSRRIRCDGCGSQCNTNTNTANTFKPQVSLTFSAPPSCLTPSSLAAGSITASGATVSWGSVAGATSYEYAVTTSATPPVSGTNTTSTSIPVTGLTSATLHYLHVRTNCGGTFSGWATNNFTTLCNATTIPYSQNFDGVTAPTLPSCILVENINGSNTWGNLASPSTVVIGSPNSMIYAYNSTVAADDWFYLQGLNLTAGTSYRLSFNWKSNPSYPEKFEVKYGTSAAAASMTAGTLYNNTNAASSTPQTQSIDFTPSSTGVFFIGFHCYSLADMDFLSIDNISVDLSPSCANPTGLFAVATGTGTTANLSWMAPTVGTPTGFEWAVTTSATPPASGTATTDSSATATGLTANTQYYLHVRTNCGGAGFSSWSTFTFSTLVNDEACGAVTLTLGGAASCGNSALATSVSDPTLPASCSAPNNTLWYAYTPTVNGPVIIRTEIPGMTSNGLNGWIALYTATGSCPSLTLTALAGSSCLSFGPAAGDVDSLTTPSLTAGTTYYIMIDGVSGDVGEFCISLVTPPAPPLCTTNISPANAATGVNITPAPTLTWNTAANASSYDVYLGTVNPPTTNIGNVTSTTTSVNGLAYNTTYYWYVAPKNTGGAATGCSNSVTSFTTSAEPANCIPLTSSGCSLSDRIDLFRLKGESSELLINTGTTCASGAYTDTTDHPIVIDLARGKTYWGQMKAGTTNDYLTIWIDGNDNGIFENTERLMNNYLMPTTTGNFNLFIPLSTPLGNHRMRARLVYYSSAPTTVSSPCGSFAYSDTKDFLVNVTASGSTYNVATYASSGACYTGAGDIVVDPASNNNANYVPLVDSSNALIAQLYPQGNDLGKVTVSYFINPGAVRQTSTGQYYLDRNITINVSKAPTVPYNLRLPYKNSELNALIAQPGSGVTSQFDLAVTKNNNGCLNAINTNSAVGPIIFPTGFGSISGDRFLDFTGVEGFSSFYLHGGSAALPVKIEYFKGEKQGRNNQLDWKVTCSNTNHVTITLESSKDSRSFTAIHELTATAQRCLQPFSFTDTRSLAGINYYRIKVTEDNGSFTYSNIVTLLNKEKGSEIVTLAPNPTKGDFKLNIITNSTQKMELAISDLQGRIVKRQAVQLIAGSNVIHLDVSSLASGNYQIQGISTEGKTGTMRFVKQ
jgi:hypothetical protein